MNGVVVLDKPMGRTSRDMVDEVKRALGIRKAGHTGTLDPLATGVLPVCLGEATKLVQFLVEDSKDYRATLLLGVKTDTLDTQGEVIDRKEPCVTSAQVEEALLSLVGIRTQIPPLYSAVKVRGRPIYDWTRRGIEVERLSRQVEIFRIEVEEVRLPEATFTVSCSKGTYIRSLCDEVGEMLGCGGCMSGLRRVRSGSFHIEGAVAMEGMTAKEKGESLLSHLLPMADLLPDMAAIAVDDALAERLRRGFQPDGGALAPYHIPFLAVGDVVRFTRGERLVAMAQMLRRSEELVPAEEAKQAVRILRVFND